MTCLLTVVAFTVSAQVALNCVIVDPAGEPLPRATAYCLKTHEGMAAGADGRICLAVSSYADTVVFSSLGYREMKISAGQAALQGNVALARQAYVMRTVVVKAGEGEYVPLYDRYRMPRYYAPKIWRCVAVRIADPSGAGRKIISKVEATVLPKAVPEKKYIPRVYVRIFAVGPDGLPGDDLLTDMVEVDPAPGRSWISVDVSSYGIVLPAEGIYAGFEWIPSADTDMAAGEYYRRARENAWPMICMTDYVKAEMTAYKLHPGGRWLLRDEYCDSIDRLTGVEGGVEVMRPLKMSYPDFNVAIGVKLGRAPKRVRDAK